jgi:hypothetical protein
MYGKASQAGNHYQALKTRLFGRPNYHELTSLEEQIDLTELLYTALLTLHRLLFQDFTGSSCDTEFAQSPQRLIIPLLVFSSRSFWGGEVNITFIGSLSLIR